MQIYDNRYHRHYRHSLVYSIQIYVLQWAALVKTMGLRWLQNFLLFCWGGLPWSKIAPLYARNTLGSICRYKEDGLVSRPPTLFTSMRQPMHGTSCPKSQLKSTCLTAKFGSFLDHAETGGKGQNVIISSVQHPISLIFAIHVSFIIPLPMMWILLIA